MFPLTVFYRADYKDKAWLFHKPGSRDAYTISEWLTDATGHPESWHRRIFKQLLQEFRITAALPHRLSWVVTVYNKRVLFFEVTELPAMHISSLPDAEIHLTGPPALLNDPRAAFIGWRRVIKYLRALHSWRNFYVHLDISRDTEAKALEKLGFEKLSDFSYLCRPNGPRGTRIPRPAPKRE